MRQTNIKAMVEAGVMSAVAIVFALISAYIPVIGMLVNLVWPVPIILLGVRHGYRWSIMATVTAGIIIAVLLHPLQAVSVVVGFGLIGIALGHAFRQGFGPWKAMLWGSVASLISKAAIIGIGIVVMGVNPLNMQADMMDKAMSQAMDVYRNFGVPEQEMTKISEMMSSFKTLFPVILPAGFAMAAVVDTYLNFIVARAVLRRLGHHIAAFPPFKEWVLPQWVLVAFIAAMGLIYLGSSQQIDLVYKLGANLQVLTSVLLFTQGLAVFYFLADKYNLSRMVRGIILLLIFTNSLFSQVVLFAGVFDIAVDYRQLRRKPHSS